MYFMVKDSHHKTICEVGIYSDKDNTERWNNKMYVSFNIDNYSNFLIEYFDKAQEIKDIFSKIQNYVLDYNENVTGNYPERKLYSLEDPQLKNDRLQMIQVTRDRLYSIVNDLGDTGIYVNED